MSKPQFVSAAEAVEVIKDGAVVALCGTGPVLEPDQVLAALETRFTTTGSPQGLTVVPAMCTGDQAGVGGLNTISHEGLLKKFITSSIAIRRHPKLIEMLRNGACEGYMIGMGTLMQLFGAIGAGKPGVLTEVGLGTFQDPRVEGGRMNERSTRPPVEVVQLRGKEYLFYPSFPVDVAIIRATTADENGYLSLEEEPNSLGVVNLALAAKASGGRVIAQVKRVARAGSLDARLVRVPGPLVDLVVVHPQQTQLGRTMMDPAEGWNPALTGAMKVPLKGLPPVPAGPERLILRRAALELRQGDVVNVGGGIPTDLPRILHEEDALEQVVFTNEHGIFGGLMATAIGGSFVPALNPDAIMDSAFQFDFYEGGGLDVAFLGAGQIDAAGNVNVSKFGPMWNAAGGFCSITERTPRIVFCAPFTTRGLEVEVTTDGLRVVREGQHPRFVANVEQVTFNAARALRKGQDVRYVTERAVFTLTEDGPVLTEIAPGIDIDTNIRPHVGFPVQVSDHLSTIRASVYRDTMLELSWTVSASDRPGPR